MAACRASSNGSRKRRKGVHLLVNANAFQRNAGFRMDFLLLSPDLVPRLAAAEVDAEYRGRDKPSDHAPVWIRLG